MERLYDLLHRVSRATHRKGVLGLGFVVLDGQRAGMIGDQPGVRTVDLRPVSSRPDCFSASTADSR